MNDRHGARRHPIALAVATALGTGLMAGGQAHGAETFILLAPDDGESLEYSGVHVPAVATDADGDAVAAWVVEHETAETNDSVRAGVYFRRLTADNTLSDIVTVVETTEEADNVYSVDVSMDADGDFVLVWSRHDFDEDTDTGSDVVEMQRFNADGTPAGSTVLMSDDAEDPDVNIATDAAGNYMVVWTEGDAIQGQVFLADGTPVGGNIRIDTAAPGPGYPDVEAAPGGGFVVGWTSEDGPFSSRAYFRRFTADGTTLDANEVLVDDPDDGYPTADSIRQHNVRVSVDADGDFALQWSTYAKYGGLPPDSMKSDLNLRRFAADGTPLQDALSLASREPEPVTLVERAPVGLAFEPSGDVRAYWMYAEPIELVVQLESFAITSGSEVSELPLGIETGDCAEGCRAVTDIAFDADGDAVVGSATVEVPEGGDTSVNQGLQLQRVRNAQADIAATLTTSADQVEVGDDVTVTLKIANLASTSDRYGIGELDASVGRVHGVTAALTFPGWLEIESTDAWTCTTTSGTTASCVHGGPLSPGEELIVASSYTAGDADIGEHAIEAVVTTDTADPDTDNNTAKATVTVAKPDDNTSPPTTGGGGGGGGALGWLALLLAPLVRRRRTG